MSCNHKYKHLIQDRTLSVCSKCGYAKAEQDADALGSLLIKTKAKLAEAKRDLRMMCDFVEAGQITAAHVLAAKLMGHKANDTGGK